MVFSFKISRIGSRYRPKSKSESPSVPELDNDEVDAPADQLPEIQFPTARKRSVDAMEDYTNVAKDLEEEEEVSFILNIFPDGYRIVNPSESNAGHQSDVQDDLKFLCPYDRRSESLITAIECGQLPLDFLDDVHCKYTNGAVLCEVRDYRNKSLESAVNDSFPYITKVSLKMSLDKVVKDINLIVDSTWEYGDLLEAESRILYALQPKLCLDPTPNLNRLCKDPTSIKLNLDIRGKRLKRLRQVSTPENSSSSVKDSREVTVQPDMVNLVDQIFGQSNMVATGPKNQASENSNSRLRDLSLVTGQPYYINLADQNVGQSNMVTTRPKNQAPENSNMKVGDLRWIKGQPDFLNMIEQNAGQSNTIATGPKNHASVYHQSSHQIGTGNVLNKQDHANDINSNSITSSVYDKRRNQCQVSSTINLNKRRRSTRASLDCIQHIDNINARKYHLINTHIQLPLTIQQINDRIYQYNVKKEPVETEKINNFEPNRLLGPQQFTRANFQKVPWNNMNPNLESNSLEKELFSGSGGLQFDETRSLTFCDNKSTQQAQTVANWRSNILQKTPLANGLVSSSSAGNMIHPVDRNIQDRFSKINMLTARFKLNCRKNKIDKYKPIIIFPTEQLKHVLFDDDDNDNLNDETCKITKMPLSMSPMCGNINICKTRVINFVKNELPTPENGFVAIPKLHTRLILSERQSDGTVAMHLGELDAVDYLAEDQLLPTIPNTHMADLLAEQFCFLMLREGYHLAGDHLKPKSISMVESTDGQPKTSPEDFNRWLHQIMESDPRKSVYEVDEPSFDQASLHKMHLQSIGLFPGISTSRMHPHRINNNRESQHPNQFLQKQEQYQIQRGVNLTTGGTGHRISGDNNSIDGFQGWLGMGDDGHAGTRVMSPMISQNPMASKQEMGERKAYGPGGLVAQFSNFGGLQGANRRIHLGSVSGSGSRGVLMLDSGTGIDIANDMNPVQRNIMACLNPNQNRYMNQQFQLIKQEPTSHLQAVVLSSQQSGWYESYFY